MSYRNRSVFHHQGCEFITFSRTHPLKLPQKSKAKDKMRPIKNGLPFPYWELWKEIFCIIHQLGFDWIQLFLTLLKVCQIHPWNYLSGVTPGNTVIWPRLSIPVIFNLIPIIVSSRYVCSLHDMLNTSCLIFYVHNSLNKRRGEFCGVFYKCCFLIILVNPLKIHLWTTLNPGSPPHICYGWKRGTNN